MSQKDDGVTKKFDFKKEHMLKAIELSRQNLSTLQGGPFGAVITRQGKVVAEGQNLVLQTQDPTAHAEVVAIRRASSTLYSFDLSDCEMYTSCEPCPMCLAAIYWARIPVIYYGNTRKDAAEISFDDDFIYTEIPLSPEKRKIKAYQCCEVEAKSVFQDWKNHPAKQQY